MLLSMGRLNWHKSVLLCIGIIIVLCYFPNMFYYTYSKDGIFFKSVGYKDNRNSVFCYKEKNSNLLKTILKSPPVNPKRIFFIESSCNTFVKGDFELNARQACAVESAAKMNPNSEVTVLFASPIKIEDPLLSENDLVHVLLSYPNVHLKHIPVEDFVRNTSLQELYQSGVLQDSSYPVSHASDFLRYLTLWKYGGTYLDLDIVVMKSLEKISNFAGAESTWAVAAGVVNFENELGHDVATDCVNELKNNFQRENWGSNGPGVITRVLNKRCHAKEVFKMLEEDCQGFKVLLPSAFYPIPWTEWEKYFNESNYNETLKKISDSYIIHVWNKHSTSTPIRVGSNQPYGVIASKYCPEVYSKCGSKF